MMSNATFGFSPSPRHARHPLSVMPRACPSLRHARARRRSFASRRCPGHPRSHLPRAKDVDGRERPAQAPPMTLLRSAHASPGLPGPRVALKPAPYYLVNTPFPERCVLHVTAFFVATVMVTLG